MSSVAPPSPHRLPASQPEEEAEQQPRKRHKRAPAPAQPAPRKRLARSIQAELTQVQEQERPGQDRADAPGAAPQGLGVLFRVRAWLLTLLAAEPALQTASSDEPARNEGWFDPCDRAKVRLPGRFLSQALHRGACVPGAVRSQAIKATFALR